MAYKCIIKKGNLLNEEKSTFIINASNTRLILGSGVSMAFKRHCGIQLQTEMYNKLNNLNTVLKKGDVVATSSGIANNFIYTLHVAVMDYNKGVKNKEKLPTINNINSSLKNIELYLKWYFQEKDNENIKLTLPLMGCGAGELDELDVLQLYKSFFQEKFLLIVKL